MNATRPGNSGRAQREQRERRLERLPQYDAGDFLRCGECGEEFRPDGAGELQCGCARLPPAQSRGDSPSPEQIAARALAIRAAHGHLPAEEVC